MCNGGYGLHLNGIHLLQWMIQYSRRVDRLKSQVLVIEVANEQGLCRKGIRLYIDICSCDAAEKGALADVGVPTYQ